MSRYKNIKIRKTSEGKRYRRPVFYPDITPSADDIYVTATYGTRYDVLAQKYYQNKNDWWIIAMASTGKKDTLMCIPGTQVVIPSDVASIRAKFKKINDY